MAERGKARRETSGGEGGGTGGKRGEIKERDDEDGEGPTSAKSKALERLLRTTRAGRLHTGPVLGVLGEWDKKPQQLAKTPRVSPKARARRFGRSGVVGLEDVFLLQRLHRLVRLSVPSSTILAPETELHCPTHLSWICNIALTELSRTADAQGQEFPVSFSPRRPRPKRVVVVGNFTSYLSLPEGCRNSSLHFSLAPFRC
eukprot:3794380-Rhodomonas_salina.1